MEISVLVVPNSKKSGIEKLGENSYKIRVDAPARDGKANKRLVEIISEYFNISKSSVILMKGKKGRKKVVKIKK